MNARRCLTVVTSALVVIACSGATTSSADLAGTWNVSKYELVSASNSATKVELISAGASITVVLKSDGTYQIAMKTPGQPDENITGTWSASSDTLTTTQTGRSGNMQFDYALSGTTLTLSGADTDWDFNGDEVAEPAKLNITAARR